MASRRFSGPDIVPVAVPVLSLGVLAVVWGHHLSTVVNVLVAFVLAAAVLTAVQHAEVVAHRVGEPFGSLVLAVAVTVIEVGLILTLMLSGDGTATLARDTVFAAAMITVNGIVGLSLVLGTFRFRIVRFNAEGSGAALATITALATLCLVLPSFTTGASGGAYTSGQLAFAALASIAVYLMFVSMQTVRHRDFFLPVDDNGSPIDETHASPPSPRRTLLSLVLLLASLVAVVGLSKVESKPIEAAIVAVGFPPSFVGVVIAMLVLLPETLAASRAARRGRIQTSLNLGIGSGIASIGLTIPTLALATVWLDTPLLLGLGPTQMVLLLLTVLVATLTIVPGRATRLQGGIHLILLAAFVFLAVSP